VTTTTHGDALKRPQLLTKNMPWTMSTGSPPKVGAIRPQSAYVGLPPRFTTRNGGLLQPNSASMSAVKSMASNVRTGMGPVKRSKKNFLRRNLNSQNLSATQASTQLSQAPRFSLNTMTSH
jgi:hypothetical protein